MSDDTVTLKEYFDMRLSAADQRYAERYESSQESVQAALTAAKEAVQKAEAASEKRFDAVNEFRATLADQQHTLLPRLEAEALIKALTDKVETLTTLVLTHTAERRGSQAVTRDLGPYLISGITLAVAIFLHYAH